MTTMRIPIDPGDKVVSMVQSYRNGAPVLLVITREGYLYEIEWAGPTAGYVVHVL